jgi:hypothetical protein
LLRLVLIGAATLSSVTACGSDDGGSGAGATTVSEAGPSTSETDVPTTEPSGSDVPADTAPPDSEPSDTAPADTETPADTEAPADGVAACPVGTWLITTEALQGFYDTVNASAGTDFSFAGEVLFTLDADGNFVYSMPDFELTNSIGGLETVVTLLGDISGTYEVVDGRFLTTIVNPDVTATVISGGAVVDGTTILEQFLTEFPVDNATFTCAGDGMVVDFPVVGSTASVAMIPA